MSRVKNQTLLAGEGPGFHAYVFSITVSTNSLLFGLVPTNALTWKCVFPNWPLSLTSSRVPTKILSCYNYHQSDVAANVVLNHE